MGVLSDIKYNFIFGDKDWFFNLIFQGFDLNSFCKFFRNLLVLVTIIDSNYQRLLMRSVIYLLETTRLKHPRQHWLQIFMVFFDSQLTPENWKKTTSCIAKKSCRENLLYEISWIRLLKFHLLLHIWIRKPLFNLIYIRVN